MAAAPQLSIVVPTLNEAGRIGLLIEQLARQSMASRCELIVTDGNSDDDTRAQAQAAALRHGLVCTVLSGARGRGAQMNRGAKVARAPELLFLHADTELADRETFAAALMAMEAARVHRGERVAGHFPLRFARTHPTASLAYFFFEAKTALNRAECINGDQGMWFDARYFVQLGGFDTSLEYMEDARIARRVHADGHWITLPGFLITSARRFESEGFAQRQTLNAVLRCCDAIGLHAYFHRARAAYREQGSTGQLRLRRFVEALWDTLRRQGLGRGIRFLGRAGRYIAGQGWQLAFLWDCRRALRSARPSHPVAAPTVAQFDRWIGPLLCSWLGSGLVAAALGVGLFIFGLVSRRK